MKKLLAMLLVSAVVFTSMPLERAFADEVSDNAASEEQETETQNNPDASDGGGSEEKPSAEGESEEKPSVGEISGIETGGEKSDADSTLNKNEEAEIPVNLKEDEAKEAPDEGANEAISDNNKKDIDKKTEDTKKELPGEDEVNKNDNIIMDKNSLSVDSVSLNKTDEDSSVKSTVSENKDIALSGNELNRSGLLKGNSYVSGKFEYELTDYGKVRITGYTEQPSGQLIIPDIIDGKEVTEIKSYAFYGARGFSSLSLGKNITDIGAYAFQNCTGLQGDLKIPDSVTYLGTSAFDNCSGLNGTLTIGNGVTTIGSSAFSDCNGLKKLVLGNKLSTIGAYAFENCNGFTGAVTIPDSVVAIRKGAFRYCSGFNNLRIGNSVTVIEGEAFYKCKGISGTVVIPDSVTEILYMAFSGCSGITGLRIGNNVSLIEHEAFEYCTGIKEIILGNRISSIGGSAFYRCTSLSGTLTIPASVSTMGSRVFDESYNVSKIVNNSGVSMPANWFLANDNEYFINSLGQRVGRKDQVGKGTYTKKVDIPVTSVKLNKTSLTLETGEGDNLAATITPSNATDKSITWSSNNTAVATVNSSGYVKAVKAGSATITVKTASGGKTATCSVKVVQKDMVKAFVTRMYTVVLERQPDAEGLAYWTQQLKNGSETGASLMSLFFLGDELTNKHLSNRKYVQLAYQGALGRNPDAEGTAYWVDALDSGTSPQFLVCGCVASQEFNNMCASYGIKAGSISVSEERDKNLGVTKFVSRLYTKALGRNYDADGLNYWCGVINANPSRDNVIQVAMDGCFHSQEFLNKNLSNRDFVTVAYRTFLGREADLEGYNYWLGQLAGGMSRDEMIRNCAYSQEFSNIMASYGL